MIKAIIFDWFGVCTAEKWADVLGRELSAKLGVEPSTVKEKLKPLVQPFAKAELSPEQFLEKFIESLDRSKDPQEFQYLFETLPELNKELLEYILELRKRYPVFLLSNNFDPVFPHYEERIDFSRYFNKLFLSQRMKMSKTQDEIWDKVLPEIGLEPSEIVFVDDQEKYLEPARKRGVNTILFLSNEQAKRELASFSVIAD